MSRIPVIVIVTLSLALAAGTTVPCAADEPGSAPDTPTPEPDLTQPDGSEQDQTLTTYLTSIRTMEREHGAFHPDLAEELTGLGLTLQQQGRHQEALEVFNRSLYISRANWGLDDAGQLPILENIIQSNHAINDRDALDQNYQYLYWVNSRLYGSDDIHLLPILERAGNWNLHAAEDEEEQMRRARLQRGLEHFARAVAITANHYGPEDRRMIEPLYNYAYANYRVYSLLISGRERESRLDMAMENTRRERYAGTQESTGESCPCYSAGKNAIMHIININRATPDAGTDAVARALIHLGDWDLLFGRRVAAIRQYAEAYALMQEDAAEEAALLMGQPRRLPDFQPAALTRVQESAGQLPQVSALLDITRSGRPRNIRIVEANPADDISLQRRAKRIIKATRYRPRFEAGQAVATSDLNDHYVLNRPYE